MPSFRGSCLVLVTLLSACASSTTREPVDAGTDATTPRDAGRDSGPLDGGPRGESCRRDADCADGVCRFPLDGRTRDLAPAPLECGAPIAGASPASPCEARDACDRGMCALAGVCVRACAEDADCASDERCQRVYVPSSPGAMQTVDACVAIVAAPDGVRVDGPSAGPTLAGGFNETTDDALQPDASGALYVWLADEGSTPYLAEVRTTAGEVLFDALVGNDPNRASPVWGASPATITDVVTLLYPNGTRVPSSGGFVASFAASDTTATRRVVLSRASAGRTIDLDLYVVGVDRWRGLRAVPWDLQEGLDDLRAIWTRVGIELGEVRIHHAVGALADRYAVLEAGSGETPPELLDLYTLSAGARRPSVHVFMVRAIDGALGIASGIPGPHALPGTAASGVAISADLLDDVRLGVVLAHEIGHFMGLFHTSEANGSINDPFDDTPECRRAQDRNGDGFVAPNECADRGGDNVMFWAGLEDTLSAEQAELMRRAYFAR